MAKRLRAPYFQVAFKGPIGGWSSGTWSEGWTRRAYIDIGPYRIRNVVSDSGMSSALSEAAGDPQAVIGLGKIMVGRWVLSVSSDGHTERQGLLMFVGSNLGMLLLFGLIGFLLAAVFSGLLGDLALVLMVPVVALGLAQTWMNVKAWIGTATAPGA